MRSPFFSIFIFGLFSLVKCINAQSLLDAEAWQQMGTVYVAKSLETKLDHAEVSYLNDLKYPYSLSELNAENILMDFNFSDAATYCVLWNNYFQKYRESDF